MYEQQHRLCVHSPSFSSISRPFGHHIRSFLGHLSFPSYCFPSMRFIRLLDLSSEFNYQHPFYRLKGIEQLVHLKFLALNDVRHLPASIRSLVKLEFLLVKNAYFEITPVILKMAKLRYLHVGKRTVFSDDCDIPAQTNNLESLSSIRIFELKDEEILRSLPHLRKLKCTYESLLVDDQGECHCPDLQSFPQLESLSMNFSFDVRGKFTELNLPSAIRKLTLDTLGLPWEKISIIGSLPCLAVLKLLDDAFIGETWETKDGEFQELIYLKIQYSDDLVYWNASSEHFPKLQQLVLRGCKKLLNIPSEIGDIATLHMIEVTDCDGSIMVSAVQIQEEQWDMGNQDLKIIIIGDDFSFSWDSPADVTRDLEAYYQSSSED